MEESNYIKRFEQQFYPIVNHLLETGSIVISFDGHCLHTSISLIKKALTLGIHLFCLPPNTTHILHPLDISVSGPMKQRLRQTPGWAVTAAKHAGVPAMLTEEDECNYCL